MAWLDRFWNVLRPGRLQRDLERELRFHVAERIDELREQGFPPAEANRLARLQFGGLDRQLERTRDMDIHERLQSILRNLRYAFRSLAKTPGFALTVVLTLALGIGANSAVFSAIDAVLLRPLPFPQGDRLMRIQQQTRRGTTPPVAPTRLEDWNRLSTAFSSISGYYTEDVSDASGQLPEKIKRAWVAPRFLETLGIAPLLGRDFTPEEQHFGGPDAVLISDALWRRRFGGDPHAIGKSLRLTPTPFRIVGVLPANFAIPSRDVDVWCLSAPDAPFAQDRQETWFTVLGRLKPGVTMAEARANLAAVQQGLGERYPKTDARFSILIQPLKEVTVGGVRKSLWLLFGSVTLLLLIACTNIAALLLARSAGRGHETSVRFSLGASRASVAAQMLTEVLVLAFAGAVLGLAVAAEASEVFRALARDLPRLDEIRLNGAIVLYSLVCALTVTFVAGLVPAIHGTRRSLASSLAGGGRAQVSGRRPLQFLLVGVQVALAATLLAGAGLLLRSFQELARVSPGFDPQHVLTFQISASWGETNDRRASHQRTARILEGLRALPGVEVATAAMSLPGVPNDYPTELKITEGRAESEPKMIAESRGVNSAYFDALHIPILSGQLCDENVDHSTVMVNRRFVSLYFEGQSPIGHHLIVPNNAYFLPAEVTGVVGDARESGMDREPPPTVYWCGTAIQPGMYFLVRTHGDPAALAGAVRRRIHDLAPARSVYDLTPLTSQLSDAYAENRLRTVLLVCFAVTAIALASLGLYGTLSYLVNLRRREVALRIALGAARTQVVRQFLSQGLIVSALGCLAGLALALALGRLIAGMLYGVSIADAATFAGVTAIVLAVAAAASLRPSIRAARVEPMQALREE